MEEERARARGILTEAEKRQVEYRDRQIAEQYQQENIERYLEFYCIPLNLFRIGTFICYHSI